MDMRVKVDPQTDSLRRRRRKKNRDEEYILLAAYTARFSHGPIGHHPNFSLCRFTTSTYVKNISNYPDLQKCKHVEFL